MADGAAEQEEVLRRQIAVMSPDRFEQLTFELAHRENPAVRRIAAPDGGADTVLPRSDGSASEVWQAKRYADEINWAECEKSLETAITRWRPCTITFVFARDLSAPLEQSFQTRLVEHSMAREHAVRVTQWNLSELIRRFNQHEDIRVRFFGSEQETVLEALDQTIKAGGLLTSSEDLVKRAETLSEWAEKRDRDFTHSVTSSGLSAPAPNWDRLPYMSVEIQGTRTRVNIAAWPREGASVEQPVFAFTNDKAGQDAREQAVAHLARGEPATVTEGAQVHAQAPEVMRGLLPSGEPGAGEFTLLPSEPISLEVEATTDDGIVSRSIPLYTVPPPPGAAAAFAGYSGLVLAQITIRLLDEPQVSLGVLLSARFGQAMRANADAARLLNTFYSHRDLVLRSESLFPSGEAHGPFSQDHGISEERLAQLRMLGEFFDAFVFVTERLGVELPIPDAVTAEDTDIFLTAANILRTGKGTATFTQISGMVESPTEIPGLPERLRGQGPYRRMVTYNVFGQDLVLGLGEYEIPPLRIVAIIPYGDSPTAPARVVLEADGDSEMEFRLTNWTPENPAS
ncbi:MAG TPA: restriction endonuclease [Solirubrobacteraceae bacterium]|jgi:hypothetical protein|nr:restriction endonuclease [Solirubrobacteraceae bacterium]